MELPIGRASSSAMRRDRIGKAIFRLVVCIAAVFAVIAVFHALPLRDRPSAPAFVFLFLVYIVSATWGVRYAIFFSCLAALAFSWLLAPVGRFWVSDPRDVFMLAAFLVMAIITSDLSSRARREALNARRSEGEPREVIETIPAMAFTARPDGTNAFANRRWQDYTGLPAEETISSLGWQSTVHADDCERHIHKWRSDSRKCSRDWFRELHRMEIYFEGLSFDSPSRHTCR
jgi:K+-sensing histidine kinase KdpD